LDAQRPTVDSRQSEVTQFKENTVENNYAQQFGESPVVEQFTYEGPITGKEYSSREEMLREETHAQMRVRGARLAQTDETKLTPVELKDHFEQLGVENQQAELRARFEVEGLAFYRLHPEIKFPWPGSSKLVKEQGDTNLRIMNSVMGAMGFDFVNTFPTQREIEKASEIAKRDGLLHIDQAAITAEKAEALDRRAAEIQQEEELLQDEEAMLAMPLETLRKRALAEEAHRYGGR
jgi:hypothetical protein